ncbi:oxidoreductase [Nocardioides flavescens]|uniref:oxidoreductase n=1 Tax=Nocardioides flavescens TaxID=2691959 RepID=UPI00301E59B2
MKHLTDVSRMGYGAMQLAGPHVFGPPADPEEAKRVLVRALDLGVDHIDTSDFYGPFVTNEIIREALHPYDRDLCIVTKVGARRDDEGNWLPDFEPESIRRQVHDNLGRLGTDRLGGVNLRLMDPSADFRAQWEVLAELQSEGLIGDLGLSEVTAEHVATAQEIAPVACVQNQFNIAQRGDDPLIASLAEQGVLYVPYFPLGGFTPFDTTELDRIGASYDATGRQVALAWLLQHSPNILLIPGTSSVAHLEENVAARDLVLSDEDVAALDSLHPA